MSNSGGITFVGDASGVSAASAEARQSVASVAKSAEDARLRIKASYDAQIKSAQEAGESQRQLASITRQYTAITANVTEESVQRSINSVDKLEARLQRYRAAISSLVVPVAEPSIAQPQSQFSFGGLLDPQAAAAREFAAAIEGVNEAHTRGIPPAVQFGSVLRGMEGNFTRNVRAAEAFGSSLSFLGPLVDAAFPVVGAATLGYALFEMGKNAYDAFQNIVNLKSSIEALNNLQIDTDKEAQRNRDAVESSVESVLGKTGGQVASLGQKYTYQSAKNVDLSSFFYSDDFKKRPNEVKGNFESMYKSIAPSDLPARLRDITATVNGLESAIAGVKDGSISAFNLPSFAGTGPGVLEAPAKHYESQLIAARQIQSRLSGASDARTASLQQIQTEIEAARVEAAKRSGQDARQAQQKNLSEQRQLWADEIVEWQAAGTRTNAEIAEWWAEKAVYEAAGSANFREAMRHANEELVKILADTTRQQAEYRKQLKDLGADQFTEALKGPDLGQADAAAKGYSEWSRNINAYRLAVQQNGYSIEQAGIQTRLANGEITKQQAAYEMAALHAKEYADALAEINDQQVALDAKPNLTDAQRKAGQSSIDLQRTQLGGKQAVADMQDQAAIAATTWEMQFKRANQAWVGDLNNQLADLITGQRTNWAGLFRSLASDFAKIGLGQIESSLAGGSGSKASSQSGSGFGGAVKSFLGYFTGRAVGGNVDLGGVYTVGERGPETLVMGNQSGRVMPNGQSGGSSHYYTVDARGSHDPAAMQAAVARGIAAAAPHIIAGSVSAVNERNSRRPSSSAR